MSVTMSANLFDALDTKKKKKKSKVRGRAEHGQGVWTLGSEFRVKCL
jgi:hypothetical protein